MKETAKDMIETEMTGKGMTGKGMKEKGVTGKETTEKGVTEKEMKEKETIVEETKGIGTIVEETKGIGMIGIGMADKKTIDKEIDIEIMKKVEIAIKIIISQRITEAIEILLLQVKWLQTILFKALTYQATVILLLERQRIYDHPCFCFWEFWSVWIGLPSTYNFSYQPIKFVIILCSNIVEYTRTRSISFSLQHGSFLRLWLRVHSELSPF
jgi:hypothetical protein